jgi:hypothetical protein
MHVMLYSTTLQVKFVETYWVISVLADGCYFGVHASVAVQSKIEWL